MPVRYGCDTGVVRVGTGAARVGTGAVRVGTGVVRVGTGVVRVGTGAVRVGSFNHHSSLIWRSEHLLHELAWYAAVQDDSLQTEGPDVCCLAEQAAQSAVAVKNSYVEKLRKVEEDNAVFKAELGEQVGVGAVRRWDG